MEIKDFMIRINDQSLENILREYPIGADFLANFRLDNISKELPFCQALEEVDDEILEEFGLNRNDVLQNFCEFLETFTQTETLLDSVSSITIYGGINKSKESESITLTISVGEIISIVGPTGSGKSRLLNDIECLAQGDTPTGRKIMINGVGIDELQRFEMGGKLVAQLSQNMNFVMDLTVREFLEMHAKCRLTLNSREVVDRCFRCANQLAGEEFSEETKVTQLSGGQSRALMIADTAYMSDSPIVLIDEIENAGIDRRQALVLLAKKEKIIFVSTHDPLLALSADKRIIIKNGGIYKVIETSDEERKSLKVIESLDNTLLKLRKCLRAGETITEELFKK
ncbi:ATP-binding cassette domain-containing protein [Clostridium estertheticum]|uniref:ATP-binding cassette domain-containing protein n=1 Tax=Clostridium estertheticum TaxID=238834 RepID=UPI001C6DF802|nr:ABC transporter ATP-binding protein [Clostridium estertheticum]MBW9150738.1 ABC transporter ATP-binding protein [Clostridium estertheticum]WLC84529.1 ABC transporter ATP-binding protein [Clostridium estertheticum]